MSIINTVDYNVTPNILKITNSIKSKNENVLPLVSNKNSILFNIVEKYDFNKSKIDENYLNPLKITDILLNSLEYYGGVGISANQLGLPYRVFALKSDPTFICFNPEITAILDKKETLLEEGCLSYPGLIVKVKRYESIRIRFQDPYGNFVVKKFYGFTSRIAQHELDHLNGITMLDRANRFHKEKAIKKWKNNGKSNSFRY